MEEALVLAKEPRSIEGMIIYLVGMVTGDIAYREKFATAESMLRAKGAIVLHTTGLPLGLRYEDYMKIGCAMMDAADAIYVLGDWEYSPGAKREVSRAQLLGLEVMHEGRVNI